MIFKIARKALVQKSGELRKEVSMKVYKINNKLILKMNRIF
jgi:hypothetical protein